MLTLYLSCLIAGGIFVGLSVLSGVDKDADFSADSDVDGGVGELDAEGDLDADADGDIEHASIAEASHGADDGRRRRRRSLWLPILSLRFWTFGAAFFGLTGSVLTALSLSGETVTLGISSGVGVLVGSAAASIVRALRKPVGAMKVTRHDYHGAVGELLLPLKPGGSSKVRVQGAGSAQELVAIPSDGQAMARGTRVVILGLDDDGRARVAPEEQLFAREEES